MQRIPSRDSFAQLLCLRFSPPPSVSQRFATATKHTHWVGDTIVERILNTLGSRRPVAIGSAGLIDSILENTPKCSVPVWTSATPAATFATFATFILAIPVQCRVITCITERLYPVARSGVFSVYRHAT
jgi:hypothetical protein